MYNEIPKLPKVDGWKKVKILENEEPLIPLSLLGLNQIVLEPMYYKLKIKGSIDECFVRESVLTMLIEAVNKLPKNYKLVIWDAWRPIEVQEGLFEKYKQQFELENPTLTEEELLDYTQKYVSFPSFDPRKPSPHNTGGSIDISIMDDEGEILNMGTDYDEMKMESSTEFYEEKLKREGFLSEEEMEILHNRRMLYNIMTSVGFTNYSEEWWHYDFGNQFWGKSTGNKAIYGIAKP